MSKVLDHKTKCVQLSPWKGMPGKHPSHWVHPVQPDGYATDGCATLQVNES